MITVNMCRSMPAMQKRDLDRKPGNAPPELLSGSDGDRIEVTMIMRTMMTRCSKRSLAFCRLQRKRGVGKLRKSYRSLVVVFLLFREADDNE